jgi:hypothetical protein
MFIDYCWSVTGKSGIYSGLFRIMKEVVVALFLLPSLGVLALMPLAQALFRIAIG